MIQIRIPKQLGEYEAKFIGPFTMRQSVCLLFALPVCVFLYNSLSSVIPQDLLFFFMFIPAGIAYLFGWFRPYGMKFEVFLRSVFISSFVAPSKRKYCTENYYKLIADKIREEEIEMELANQKGKKQKKKKYRRSKEAIQ